MEIIKVLYIESDNIQPMPRSNSNGDSYVPDKSVEATLAYVEVPYNPLTEEPISRVESITLQVGKTTFTLVDCLVAAVMDTTFMKRLLKVDELSFNKVYKSISAKKCYVKGIF